MNSRERVLKSLNHEQPDRVPVDMGGSPVSSISAGALNDLRKALKLENDKVWALWEYKNVSDKEIFNATVIDGGDLGNGLFSQVNKPED